MDFDSTTTEKQSFIVDGKEVQVYFGVSREMSTKIGEAPMSLNSTMFFEFEPIADYTFIMRLWRIAKEFIRFLCYRKNVFLSKIEIASPYKGGKHENFATLHIVDESGKSEPDTLQKGRLIKQENISGSEGAILTDIADDLLYTRHLPNTYESGLHIDASRFIMITAAFEWEFHRLYPDGVPKKEATVLNNENLVYSEMGERLANQRNHFAHGNLDKDFIGLSLLDLICVEYVIYALQLKHYGVADDCIRKSINDLFHLNFAL